MNLLRTTFSVLALVSLALGFAASQRAFFTGTAAEYAETASQPAVKGAALAMLIAALALALLRDKAEDER